MRVHSQTGIDGTQWRWLIAGLLALLSWTAQAAPDPLAEYDLTAAEFVITDAVEPPDDSAAWQPRTLVHKWTREEYTAGSNGWYRLRIDRPQPPNEVHGVYLWRLNMNAAVYLNGQFLGDGGRFEEPVARNWNRPLYFTIPPALWQAGENILHVRLRGYPNYTVLAPVRIGPERILKPDYESRKFLQNHVSAWLFFVTLGIGIFMLALWARRPHDRMYLWFGLAMLAWSTFGLNMFIRDIPMPAKAWWWLCHVAIDTWVVCQALFVLRFMDTRMPRLEAALGVILAVAAVSLAWVPLEHFNDLASIWHSASIVFTAYLVFLLWRHGRTTGRRQSKLLALGLGTVLLAGVHDWIFQAGALPYELILHLWLRGFHLMHFSAPILFAIIAWHLTGRFIAALNESEQLNAELEDRVAASRRELEENYRRLQELAHQQAVAEERERIYRDLHDDVGAKLLSLVYRVDDSANADLARSALQDLRDVVSHSKTEALDLEAALADWHAECDQRLSAANIRLAWWQVDDLPTYRLSPQQTMNIGRILRESITNAIHHAKPQRVAVRIDYAAPDLIIEIADDGIGRRTGEWRPGRGLRNMELRARELSGQIRWLEAEPQGCKVQCRIPLQ